jgi:hypothetical protein
MNKSEFMVLCAQAKKEGPIASWITRNVEDYSLWRQYLAIQSPDYADQWKVHRYDPRSGIEDLGIFHGATPQEVYKAVPRKVLA